MNKVVIILISQSCVNLPLSWRNFEPTSCTLRRRSREVYQVRENGLFTSFWSIVTTFNTEVSNAYELSKRF